VGMLNRARGGEKGPLTCRRKKEKGNGESEERRREGCSTSDQMTKGGIAVTFYRKKKRARIIARRRKEKGEIRTGEHFSCARKKKGKEGRVFVADSLTEKKRVHALLTFLARKRRKGCRERT